MRPIRWQREQRTVGAEVRHVVRSIIAVALVLLVANVGARAYLLLRLAPELRQLRAATAQLDIVHEGVVDEETGARGFLGTGSVVFLQPYLEAFTRVPKAADALAGLVSGQSATRLLLAEEQARQAWTTDWALPAVDPLLRSQNGVPGASDATDVARRTAFMSSGKVLFDDYRAAHAALLRNLDNAIERATHQESSWLLWSGGFQALVALGAVLTALMARRRMAQRITVPVEALARGVRRIAAGSLLEPIVLGPAPRELASLGESITHMAEALEQQMVNLADQREQVRLHAGRLSTVLAAARDVAGSLSLRYVLRSVADAAAELGSDRVRIWLAGEDDDLLRLSFDSSASPTGPQSMTRMAIGTGLVGRAAKYGRPTGPEPMQDETAHALAVPMMMGGRVVGALECISLDNRAIPLEVVEILEALAGHAAGAIASAQLHQRTSELALTDALTRLPNRRAFEEDFAAEAERAERYQRPLSIISIDLDRFKSLNDRYGHAFGDLALQQTSQALLDGARGSERVYRLGGEELVVICPETDSAHAVILAERLRSAVEAAGGPDAPVVTASFGVAELRVHGSGPRELLAAADRALYSAKDLGRNRVVMAVPSIPEQVSPPLDSSGASLGW